MTLKSQKELSKHNSKSHSSQVSENLPHGVVANIIEENDNPIKNAQNVSFNLCVNIMKKISDILLIMTIFFFL